MFNCIELQTYVCLCIYIQNITQDFAQSDHSCHIPVNFTEDTSVVLVLSDVPTP